MAKFYVLSGEVRWVGEADDVLDACIKATKSVGEDANFDHFFYVDEKGFREVGLFSPNDTESVPDKMITSDYVYREMKNEDENEGLSR